MKKILSWFLIFVFIFVLDAHAVEDGVQYEYHMNGEVWYARTFKDGVRHGIAKEFYDDGTLFREVNYVEGKKQGVMKEYYPTGIIKATYEYKDDIVDGILERYYTNGRLYHSKLFDKGFPNSKKVKTFDYFEDGSLKYEYYYDKDEGGWSKTYHENGKVAQEVDIKGWGKYKCKNYDKEGNFVSDECPARL